MSAFPNDRKPLPQYEGPKLHPFRDTKSDVKSVRLLSDVDSGGHAHVFEVSIGCKAYALKILKPLALVHWIYH